MPGFSPALPMSLDNSDGFALNKTLQEVAKQNLKMLVLTAPGERVMMPDFGVGIRNYLFENKDPSTYEVIEASIYEQAQQYLPYISITNIDFLDMDQGINQWVHSLGIIINYIVSGLGLEDQLSIEMLEPVLE